MIDVLNLREPVALLIVAVLSFLPDDEQAYTAVKTLMNALRSGSYLAASHATYDLLPDGTAEAFATRSVPGSGNITGRSRTQFLRFFDGLDLVPPGVEVVSHRRPDSDDMPPPEHVSVYGGLALKR